MIDRVAPPFMVSGGKLTATFLGLTDLPLRRDDSIGRVSCGRKILSSIQLGGIRRGAAGQASRSSHAQPSAPWRKSFILLALHPLADRRIHVGLLRDLFCPI